MEVPGLAWSVVIDGQPTTIDIPSPGPSDASDRNRTSFAAGRSIVAALAHGEASTLALSLSRGLTLDLSLSFAAATRSAQA